MSTRHSFSSAPADASPRVATLLYRSLESILIVRCQQHYDAGVVLWAEQAAGERAALDVRVLCRGVTRMSVRFQVSHAGGSVYDVRCAVEEGKTRRFSYGLPTNGGAVVSRAPALGQKLASFLRDELERRLGRLVMSSPVAYPRTHRPSRTNGEEEE